MVNRKYAKDCLRLGALTSQRDSKRIGAEVLLSSLVYPGLQALYEEYLGCDFQSGGVNQVPMVSGLGGGKMSSSVSNSKIDFLDSAGPVTTRVHMAACEGGVIGGNGLLQITKYINMPVSALKADPAFEHPRPNALISPNVPTGTLFSIKVSSTGDASAERHYSSIAS